MFALYSFSGTFNPAEQGSAMTVDRGTIDLSPQVQIFVHKKIQSDEIKNLYVFYSS